MRHRLSITTCIRTTVANRRQVTFQCRPRTEIRLTRDMCHPLSRSSSFTGTEISHSRLTRLKLPPSCGSFMYHKTKSRDPTPKLQAPVSTITKVKLVTLISRPQGRKSISNLSIRYHQRLLGIRHQPSTCSRQPISKYLSIKGLR
jgi:hypothetical protein